MQEIVRVNQESIGGKTIQTVNARELHAFLEVGKKFSDWIKSRIEQYGFTECEDFLTLPQTGNGTAVAQKGAGGKFAAIEYHITLAMGKELAMVERNAKGKEARLYFIECEKRALAPLQIATPEQRFALAILDAKLMLEQKDSMIAQRDTFIAEIAPKATALDRLSTAYGSICITDAAKTLQTNPSTLFIYLSAQKWIYRRAGGPGWIAYQDKLQQMLLEHKTTTVERGDGSEKITEQVRITPKGLAKLAVLLGVKASP